MNNLIIVIIICLLQELQQLREGPVLRLLLRQLSDDCTERLLLARRLQQACDGFEWPLQQHTSPRPADMGIRLLSDSIRVDATRWAHAVSNLLCPG